MGLVRYRSDLPSYVKGMDATMCMFQANAYTWNVRPLSVMEYLAAGRPTVFRPTPCVEDIADLLYFATGVDEAAAAVRRAVAEDSDEMVERRQARARECDWDVLTKRTAEIVLDTCGG